MANRAFQISARTGVSAAILVVALIAAALAAVFGFAQWEQGLQPADWAAVRFTIWQAILSALISVGLAIQVARALARRRFAGREVLITMLGAPFILPVIVAIFGLLAVFGRAGWVNVLMGHLGLPPLSIYGLHGVVLAHVFFNLPLATRLILQGWHAIPAEQFRLAAQLQLTPRATARVLEMPMLGQVVPGAIALVFVVCLTSFAVALILGGGPDATTVELAIYQAFRFDFDLNRAALLSLVQLFVAGGAAIVAFCVLPPLQVGGGLGRIEQRWDAQGRLQRLLDGSWIILAATFLLLPLLSVVLRGLAGMGDVPASVWQAAGVSIAVSLASVALMLMLALPMSGWIATRAGGGIEAIGLLGLAASPLMIGTGWFILINPIANPFSLAWPVTALVNALMALPFALRVLVPPMRDIVYGYGRLSQTLNLTGFSLWRWLILPRLRAQIGFSAGLVGALSMGDLGVIALFADAERATLPLQMMRLMGAYQMDAAAGAGLILLALSLGIFWLFDKGGRWRADV